MSSSSLIARDEYIGKRKTREEEKEAAGSKRRGTQRIRGFVGQRGGQLAGKRNGRSAERKVSKRGTGGREAEKRVTRWKKRDLGNPAREVERGGRRKKSFTLF